MRRSFGVWLGVACAAGFLGSGTARADIGVVGRYTFVTGDTATRTCWYSRRRVRVSTPDDQEIQYDSKTNTLTFIDHGRRLYWTGSGSLADSVVDGLTAHHWARLGAQSTDSARAGWADTLESLNDFIQVTKTSETRTIAGYPCTKWTIDAGPYFHLERWAAPGLDVAIDDPEIEKLALATLLDPLGRALMSMFWSTEDLSGMPLAATMTYDTGLERGHFSWQAIRVVEGAIPDSAWQVPPGYARVDLPAVFRED
jgi:hypothetical protein